MPEHSLPKFDWADPLLLELELSEEERLIRDTARSWCEDKLEPRIGMAFREGRFDRTLYVEMGEVGFLGATIDGYGCAGINHAVTQGVDAKSAFIWPLPVRVAQPTMPTRGTTGSIMRVYSEHRTV